MADSNNRASQITAMIGKDVRIPSASALRAIREHLGFTQAVCAERIRATTKGWNNYEIGVLLIPARIWELFLYKLADDEFEHALPVITRLHRRFERSK